MPVILERLLATPFGKMVVGFVLYGLAAASNMFVRPMLDSLAHKRGSFLSKTLVGLGARYISRGIGWVEHRTRSYLSHWAAANLHPLIRLFHGLGWVVNDVNKTLLGLSASHEHVTARLRYHTIPTAVHKGVAPVRLTARQAHAIAVGADALGKQTQKDLHKGIDAINAGFAAKFAKAYHGIDEFTHGQGWARARADHKGLAHVRTHDLPNIRAKAREQGKTVAKHGSRLKTLEKVLTVAGATALVWVGIKALGLRWLRCPNWKRIGPSVCGMNANLLEQLLIDAALFTGTLSIVEFATELQGIVGIAEDALVGFVDELR